MTRPVIAPVCAFAVRKANADKRRIRKRHITFTAEAQRTRRRRRGNVSLSPCLLVSLSPCRSSSLRILCVLCASAVNVDNGLIDLPPFGLGQPQTSPVGRRY